MRIREDGVLMRIRDFYAAQLCMGERAAHERDILHAGKVKIGDKLASTAHQAIVFLAEKAGADALFFHRVSIRRDCILKNLSRAIAAVAMTIDEIRKCSC
jgi:diphthamide biosynthesis methyltransferase